MCLCKENISCYFLLTISKAETRFLTQPVTFYTLSTRDGLIMNCPDMSPSAAECLFQVNN